MAKPDQIAAIKAANGVELNVEDYTARQLEALEGLAEKDGKDNLTAFQAQLKEFDDARAAQNAPDQANSTQTPAPEPAAAKTAGPKAEKVKTVSVRVSSKIAAYGGAFLDPETRETIGEDSVEVPLTAFVRGLLRSEDLVEED